MLPCKYENFTCTVIFVVIAGSMIAANSWAAKILKEEFQQSKSRHGNYSAYVKIT